VPFMTTRESPVSQKYKEAMIGLNLDDPEFRNRVMTPRVFDPKAPRPPTEEINWADAVSFSVAGIDRGAVMRIVPPYAAAARSSPFRWALWLRWPR